jgi:hypothetical protein
MQVAASQWCHLRLGTSPVTIERPAQRRKLHIRQLHIRPHMERIWTITVGGRVHFGQDTFPTQAIPGARAVLCEHLDGSFSILKERTHKQSPCRSVHQPTSLNTSRFPLSLAPRTTLLKTPRQYIFRDLTAPYMAPAIRHMGAWKGN